jgi:hypothetical protein
VEAVEALRRVLTARADVRVVYLFGSFARGDARAGSDLDVGVVFSLVPPPGDLDGLATALEAAAGRRVDLVVLNDAPPLLAHEAIRDGRRLVCVDEDERVRFETRAIAKYLDTAHLRQIQRDYLREWVEARGARSA